MKTRSAIVLATVALAAFIAFAFAASWYYSGDISTTVISYQVTANPLDSNSLQNSIISINGTVTRGGSALSGVTVTLFNGTAAPATTPVTTTTTDILGHYAFSYNVTEPVGSTVFFRAGINQ